MSNQKDRKMMEQLDKIYKVVQQSGTGIKAIETAKRLKLDKTTVHRHLNSLSLMGKVESKSGLWLAKTGEQTIRPLEKEIVIELPIPKDQWRQIALMEMLAKDSEDHEFPRTAEMYRIPLEKLKETRTIRITGKNVDDPSLEKLGNLILQATEQSSKFNFRGLFKGLKKSKTSMNLRQDTNS